MYLRLRSDLDISFELLSLYLTVALHLKNLYLSQWMDLLTKTKPLEKQEKDYFASRNLTTGSFQLMNLIGTRVSVAKQGGC